MFVRFAFAVSKKPEPLLEFTSVDNVAEDILLLSFIKAFCLRVQERTENSFKT